MASLRQDGVEVITYRADIADREQAANVIAAVRGTMGPLRGVVHAAMVLDDAPIEGLTEDRMWKAMAPKIMGAGNLHVLTIDTSLDFFVLFSSFSSMTGNPGQANYCAGNAFLDSLAYYRRSRGLCALTVNWGMVGDVGHVANSPETSDRFNRMGASAIPIADILDVLDELLSSNAVQVGVAQMRWKNYLSSVGTRIPARLAGLGGENAAGESHSTESPGVHDILKADTITRPALLVTYIRDILARTIGASLRTHRYPAASRPSWARFPNGRGNSKPNKGRPRHQHFHRKTRARHECELVGFRHCRATAQECPDPALQRCSSRNNLQCAVTQLAQQRGCR